MGSLGPKKEFYSAVVNKPSVFEPLKFYCIHKSLETWLILELIMVLYNTESSCSKHYMLS